MSETDREALRRRAREFVNGPEFTRHYEKNHFPAWIWYLFQILRCLTLVGLPVGIRALAGAGEQAFASPKLLKRYRELVETGRIVRGFLVLNSSALHGDPKACAPALVLASLDGTDHGDAVAEALWDPIVDRILMEELAGPGDTIVAAMVADEEYRPFRKRRLPSAFTDGREACFLDVRIDNELLRGNSLGRASDLFFLVDPAPRGLILQIPQEASAVPPPLPVQA